MVDAVRQGLRFYLEYPWLHDDDYAWAECFPSAGLYCGRRAFERLKIEVDRERLISHIRD